MSDTPDPTIEAIIKEREQMRADLTALRSDNARLTAELGVQKVFTLAARKDRDDLKADNAALRAALTSAMKYWGLLPDFVAAQARAALGEKAKP
jgi:cell division protein FtsB